MTAKEAADRLELHKEWGFVEETIQAIDMAITALEQQISGGWITVEDRLPEKETDCLVCYYYSPKYVTDIGTYMGNSWALYRENGGYFHRGEPEIVAWQPLPEAYRPEG